MNLWTSVGSKLAEFKEQLASRYPLPGLRIGDKEAAVAREGGIGVIAANAIGMTEADYYADPVAASVRALRREIREPRRRSTGLIGVNIMVAVDRYHRLLDVAIEEKADVLFLGAGLPIKGIPVRAMRDAGVQVEARIKELRAELDSVLTLAPAFETA